MATMTIKSLFSLLVLSAYFSFGQAIKGVVLDAKTNLPIESAAVYFDNTTMGTATNANGEFEIEQNKQFVTPLVISFLGYQKVQIMDYDASKYYKVLLEEEDSMLDEVIINTSEGMSYEIKLSEFKREFLGHTANAKSCEILNEEDLMLRFNKKNRQLSVSSRKPIMIRNGNLKYLITYEILDFIIDYGYVNTKSETYRMNGMFYKGTSFFKSEIEKNTEAIIIKRTAIYKGSILHFMRALRDKQLKGNNYQIFSQGFLVNPEKYIQVRKVADSSGVDVKLRLPLSILYNDEQQTDIKKAYKDERLLNNKENSRHLKISDTVQNINSRPGIIKKNKQPYFNTEISIDAFGNFSPVEAFYMSGYMGKLRVGDLLPLDFKENY